MCKFSFEYTCKYMWKLICTSIRKRQVEWRSFVACFIVPDNIYPAMSNTTKQLLNFTEKSRVVIIIYQHFYCCRLLYESNNFCNHSRTGNVLPIFKMTVFDCFDTILISRTLFLVDHRRSSLLKCREWKLLTALPQTEVHLIDF